MLRVVQHESKPLRWWYEQFLSENIDMNPPYQRKGEVWGRWKRAHLIDSIINEYDIPKFYVADFYANSSEKALKIMNRSRKGYAIIDGKQRLGAIFDFFQDQLKLNPSFVLDEEPGLKLGGLSYSEIRRSFPQIASRIDRFEPTVMNVVSDDELKIKELFVRLNSGEAATSAERRNAMGGPAPSIARELVDHPFFRRKISFGVKRMQEYQLAMKLLLLEFKGALVDTKAKNLDDFVAEAKKWDDKRLENSLEAIVDPYNAARDRVYDVLETLTREFRDNDKQLSKSSEIPIYYWFAREHPSWCNELHDFVLELNDSLLANLRLWRNDPRAGDQELSVYYTFGRTSNDAASLEGRFRIFVKRYRDFRKPGRRP